MQKSIPGPHLYPLYDAGLPVPLFCRGLVMGKSKATQSLLMRVTRRRKMSTAKPSVGAAAGTTTRTSSGSAATYARGGSMGNV